MLAALYNKTFEAGVYSKPGSWPHGLSVEKSKQRCSLSMEPRILIRWKPWQVVLLFAGLQCGLTAVGVYFFDYFAGTATVGFARMGAVHGTGMFFVYMLGAINAVVVLVPVFHLRFIGAGALVYLGWALIGVLVCRIDLLRTSVAAGTQRTGRRRRRGAGGRGTSPNIAGGAAPRPGPRSGPARSWAPWRSASPHDTGGRSAASM
jgi:hypothetical protein